MKDLIVSHVSDIDGVSPIILYSFCNVQFDYQLLEVSDLPKWVDEFLEQEEEYHQIYITDLNLPEICYQKLEQSKWKDKILVFDHHKSHEYAKEKSYVTIDTSKCATSLFYDYLKKEKQLAMPILEEYVEHVDHLDLWSFDEYHDPLALPLGMLFTIYGTETYMKEMIKKLSTQKTFSFNEIEQTLLTVELEKQKRYYEKKKEELYRLKIGEYVCGVVFAEQYRSEIGHLFLDEYSDLDLVVILNLSGGISFRTIKDHVDLSLFAQKYGGGGHPKAAGAPISKEMKEKLIFDIFKEGEFLEH